MKGRIIVVFQKNTPTETCLRYIRIFGHKHLDQHAWSPTMHLIEVPVGTENANVNRYLSLPIVYRAEAESRPG